MKIKSTEDAKDRIILGDALSVLPLLDDASVDLILTDPPYFLDKLDDSWTVESAKRVKYRRQAVNSLPPGMKFDKEQGRRMYDWYLQVSRELFRILKPGGFFFSFSSPRLYHRMACAMEDAGFEIRDAFLWIYAQTQPKAMSMDHFVDKSKAIPDNQKAEIKRRLRGWKTPQVKSCYEPIAVGQKPADSTFLENYLSNGVGLFNFEVKVGNNMYPSNILVVDPLEPLLDRYFLVRKPSKQERGEGNSHLSVKPVALCEHLIQLSTVEGAVILDPFIGSGTTALAARRLRRHFIGIEINKPYVELAERRLRSLQTSLGI